MALGALAACVVASAGCSTKAPDYQSLWTTTPTTTAPAPEDDPVSLTQYLEDQHIGREQVAPESLPDLKVSMPTPKGWSKRKNPQVSELTEVIGKGDSYPTAMLTVLRLNGDDVDAAAVIKHGLNEAGQVRSFHPLDSSTADFHGFPSGTIQGSYDQGGRRLHSFFRMVVATGAAPAQQPYLVQLTIIALANRAEAEAADVETIMDGFTVTKK